MRLQNLLLLRFLAAIWVVLFHANGSLEARGFDVPFSEFFGFGGAGVDLFFVLSGFVIGLTQLRAPKSLGSFIKARLIRIVPAYWVISFVTLLVVFSLGLAGMQFQAFSQLGWEWVLSSFAFVSMAAGFDFPFVYQGWTLEFEMLFYTLFALAIAFLGRPVLQMLAATSLLLLLALVEPASLLQFEFSLGLLIAYLTVRFTLKTPYAVGFVTLGVFALWLLSDSASFDYPALITQGVPFALIVLGAANLKQLDSPFVLRLGQASYAVYLLQVLTIPIMIEFVSFLPLLPPLAALFLIGLVTQFAGMIFEEAWDVKVRSWLSKTLHPRSFS